MKTKKINKKQNRFKKTIKKVNNKKQEIKSDKGIFDYGSFSGHELRLITL